MNPNNDYDFIMNPQKPKKQPVDLMGNPKMLFAFVGFVVVVVIIIAVVLNLLLSSGNNSQKVNLTEVTMAQSEIIRISALPENNKSATESTKYRALNTKVSTMSSQSLVSSMLSARGAKKISPKDLAKSKDVKVEPALEAAEKNNRFNETYNEVLDKKLSSYKALVKKAYDSGNKKEKASLKPIYEGIEALTSNK